MEQTEGFATRLRNLRKERKLRQKDLASVLGLAQTTIANYEQNTRFPDEETLKGIVDYFNTSLDFLLGRSDEPHGLPTPAAIDSPSRSSDLTPLAKSFLESLLAGDQNEAEKIVLEACRRGRSVREIYTEVFQPVLVEVGYRWEVSTADVYQEHFATSATISLMSKVMQHANRERQHRGSWLSVVSGGEQHDIGMRMVNDFLQIAGWDALYLGTDLPSRNVIKAVEDRQADLIGISVTMQYHVNSATNLISSIRSSKSCRHVRIVVGGQAFRSDINLWKRIGADAQALSADDAVEAANRLISIPSGPLP